MPSTTEVETWIDAEGLVRRTRMQMDMRQPGSDEAGSMDVTMNFFDFGIAPDIQLPDPDTVYDMTPLVHKELGLDGSS